MAVSSEDSCTSLLEALLPVRWLPKVGFIAAGTLGIRGDSQHHGDCSEDAGKESLLSGLQHAWGLPGWTDISISGAKALKSGERDPSGPIMNAVLQQRRHGSAV